MTFAEHLIALAAPKRLIDRHHPEALFMLPYQEEYELKSRAFAAFLRELHLSTMPAPSPLLAAVKPRHYRTSGKRRATFENGKLYLHHGSRHGVDLLDQSELEEENHQPVYQYLSEVMQLAPWRFLAQQLNYCILRKSGIDDLALIINVRKLDGAIVRKLKQLSAAIAEKFPMVKSCFAYLDESNSDYYLEAERPAKAVGMKKLYGPESLDIRLPNIKLLYPVTVFSQVNQSMLPGMIAQLESLLAPSPDTRLLDLYCGYGLLGLAMHKRFRNIFGMDIEGAAIKAAESNGAYHCKNKTRYMGSDITAEILSTHLPRPNGNEVIVLDPPRRGCAPGVIETLISRKPQKIVHIFCGTDTLAKELPVYLANNFKIDAILPLDLFPGTINLETLVALSHVSK